jgi:hypothetical protein
MVLQNDDPNRFVGPLKRTDVLALALLVFAVQAEIRDRPWQITAAALALMLVAAVLPMLRKLRIETPVGTAEAEPVMQAEGVDVRAATEPRQVPARGDE